jgi:YihY family inner membrane protein
MATLQAFFTKFTNDWSMNFAGGLAYNLLIAMLPIAVALFGILGLVLGNNSDLVQTIIQQLTDMGIVPKRSPSESSVAEQTINLALQQLNKNAGLLLVIAILLAAFGGSRLFIALEGYLDIIYRVRPRSFLRQNLMAFSTLLLFIILVPLMVFASAAPTVILAFLSNNPALTSIPLFLAISHSPITAYLAAALSGFLVGFILFETIYFVVPNQTLSWRNSWPGAVVAAAALEIFFVFFPLYVKYSLSNYSGQIGFAVISLLFFYYFALILIFGAEINAFFFEKVQPLPHDLATFVSTMAEKLYQDIPNTEEDIQYNKPFEEHHQRVSQILTQQTAPTKQRHLAWLVVLVTGSALVALIEWLRFHHGRK